MSEEVLSLTLRQLRDEIAAGELDPAQAAQAYLGRIRQRDGELGCFLTVDEEQVMRQAEQARQADGPLAGVPIAVKDNICTKGLRTTAGSRMLEDFSPPYDATAVKRLREAGAVILGKANLDEFAMGSANEYSAFRPAKNPHDPSRVPGGSSGGPAAAVAARLAPAALGSDTGGSIRQPAAFCGVVGLKPTYGRISRYGLIAFASSLDQIGPITRDVADAALLLEVLCGRDPNDATTAGRPREDFSAAIEGDVKGLTVGVPRRWMSKGLSPQVESAVSEALKRLQSLGCEVVDIDLPLSRYAIAIYYILAPAEASSNLMRYDGVRYGYRSNDHQDLESMYRRTRTRGFGREVKRRIMLGTFVLSAGYIDAYYTKAAKARRLLLEEYEKAFEKVDLIAAPTTPTPPFKRGEKTDEPLQMYLSDIYTVTANLTGLPAISIPAAEPEAGIGLQLLAPHFGEGLLLRAAHAFTRHLSGS